MNHLLILLSIVLFAGLFAPVYAQTISENVIINEVDTNPFGDDSKSISEWVELYNPTNSDVDLSGWEIASTSVLKKTFTIPDGTIISPGKYISFINYKIWFTDTSDSIELKNKDGLLIDKTPEVYDLDSNSKTWQRTYDGSSDWKFATGTPKSSNGKFIADKLSDVVVVTVSSNQPSYIFDETAIITGTVSKKLYNEKLSYLNERIIINISGSDFSYEVSVYPDANLKYQTSLKLSSVKGINEGYYNVSVNYGGIVSTAKFYVGFEVIEAPKVIETSFNVESEKSQYVPGELVSIDGIISDIIPFESVVFTITDSAKKLVYTGNLFPSDGKFSTSVLLSTVNPNYGIYTITAEYGDLIRIITFDVVEKITDKPLSKSINLNFNLDHSEYLISDFMTLSGEISNYDPKMVSFEVLQSINFNFKDSKGKFPTITQGTDNYDSLGSGKIAYSLTTLPDSSGKFSITHRIPAVAFSEGDYTVTAKYAGLTKVETFSIVNEKSKSDEKSDITINVKTIIEKVNGISDNLISIMTSQKLIDEEIFKPRVISGSMVTISKDDVSDVNLRVLSNTGICVIGPEIDCLVSESTRKPGQIFEVVEVDGMNLNVRYSGSDVRLEKFSILPQSPTEFLPDANWKVEVIKDDQVSKLYYKVTYKTSQ